MINISYSRGEISTSKQASAICSIISVKPGGIERKRAVIREDIDEMRFSQIGDEKGVLVKQMQRIGRRDNR